MIRGTVVIKGAPKKMKGLFNDFVKAGMQQLVKDWHKDILPGHFEVNARKKYRYAPRTGKYWRYKKKHLPNSPDLVYTGTLRDMMTRAMAVSGTKKKAKGTMTAPRYAYMKRNPFAPDKMDEATRVTKKEVTAMAKLLHKKVTKRLNLIKATEVIR